MKNINNNSKAMLPRGNNRFNGRFDFFEWSAPYYKTPEEVVRALMKLPLIGKSVKDIKVIGCVTGPDVTVLSYAILNSGIELEDRWWETYPHIDDIRIPWEVCACEPFQLIFDDDTTLEILPTESGGARIAMNSIPVDIIDGLNNSNFNSYLFYNEIIGKTIKEINMRVISNSIDFISCYNVNNKDRWLEKSKTYCLSFEFDYPFSIKLEQSFSSYFKIKMSGEHYYFDGTKVNNKRAKDCIAKPDQVFICNGRDCGGTFWIVTMNSDKEKDAKLPFCDSIGMSIEECEFAEFFQEFVYRYFDPTIQEDRDGLPPDEIEFDWYDCNLYTYENMRKMILDIRKTANMLENDYDNPELDTIKSHFTWYFETDLNKVETATESEIEAFKKIRAQKAIDVYRRFADRIEKMMSLPSTDIISFAGP